MRTLHVNPPHRDRISYPLVFGRELRAQAGRWMAENGPWERVVLVCDETVGQLHGEEWEACLADTGPPVVRLQFAPGEQAKNRETKAVLEDRMLAAGLGRGALVVALGGGVTLDLAGFTAATFMRGVPWLALPTTTLAMVDSAIGGKTGVDTAAGKNLIGAFHPPLAVFADCRHLDSLPDDLYAEGFAEAIKHGLIASAEHFDDLEAHAAAILRREPGVVERILADSAAIKVRFVESDEFELDARKALNHGHTFAHALERLSGWRINHGQAVARGLVAESRLARALGLFSAAAETRLQDLLSAYGFPREPFAGLPDRLQPMPRGSLEPAAYLEATRTDKKNRGGKVEYVLLSHIGQVARAGGGSGSWARPVEDQVVCSALLTPATRS